MSERSSHFTTWLRLLVALAFAVGCSKPLSPTEEAFLGTWEAVFTEEDGTEVRVVWYFYSEYEGDKGVWNELHRDGQPISRRQGEWRVVNERTLRVVLDTENFAVTDRYPDWPHRTDEEEAGWLVGSLIAEIVKALTDDEYMIEYEREGDTLRMRWYNDEFHTYARR